MPNETYGLQIRVVHNHETIRVIAVVSYTVTFGPESNITLHPDEVEIEVRNSMTNSLVSGGVKWILFKVATISLVFLSNSLTWSLILYLDAFQR
jgi:hypothetical protein